MSTGYWATGISGNEPPSPKSSADLGRHPALDPYAGGPRRCDKSFSKFKVSALLDRDEVTLRTTCDLSKDPGPRILGPFA